MYTHEFGMANRVIPFGSGLELDRFRWLGWRSEITTSEPGDEKFYTLHRPTMDIS